jgi:tripartite-type tricarboxylate transporter receptor subunit TctC
MILGLSTRRGAMGRLMAMVMTGGWASANVAKAAASVTLVVPFSAGSAVDVVSRKIAQLLPDAPGDAFHVQNVTGGGGVIAVNEVIKRQGMGNTLLMATSGLICNMPHLVKTPIGFSTSTDLVPICTLANVPLLLVAPQNSKANNLVQLQALAQQSGQPLTYTATDIGSANHIAAELLLKRLQVQATHVPYRSPQGMVDLTAERLSFGINSWKSLAPFLKRGELKVLSVLSNTRMKNLPNSLTVQEQGFGHFDQEGWIGLFVAKEAPFGFIRECEQKLESCLKDPDFKDIFVNVGLIASYRNHEDSKVFVVSEIKKSKDVLQRIGLV